MQALGQVSKPKIEPCAEDAADKNGADTNGAGRGAAEGSAWGLAPPVGLACRPRGSGPSRAEQPRVAPLDRLLRIELAQPSVVSVERRVAGAEFGRPAIHLVLPHLPVLLHRQADAMHQHPREEFGPPARCVSEDPRPLQEGLGGGEHLHDDHASEPNVVRRVFHHLRPLEAGVRRGVGHELHGHRVPAEKRHALYLLVNYDLLGRDRTAVVFLLLEYGGPHAGLVVDVQPPPLARGVWRLPKPLVGR
mmetsp:Transcript_101825/g.311411  ORF Transcript_101825/g.311411 Transcript_101825/m.311411 type:complete len:248 (+) Transcript_101825:451-1194(+)